MAISFHMDWKTEKDTKFIFFSGKVETLSFFSRAIKKELEKRGFSCFLFDFDREEESFQKLLSFADEKTLLFTFNFIGLSGEAIFQEPDGSTFFEKRGIRCLNYLVDHPAYYPKQLKKLSGQSMQLCVDKSHVRFLQTYYPRAGYCAFLPLAGSAPRTCLPYEKRRDTIVFAGNYTMPETFLPFQNRLGPEEAAFYQEIIDYFRENPDTGMTEGISRFFLRDFPHIKKREMRDAVINSIFIDLYMRFYFRGAIVKSLVEHGFPLELYGSGWDRLLPEPREGLVLCGPTDTRGCLQAMSRAKVSLNVMPWFKEGAHDRFYSGMLCGSVMVSDSSQYLKETLPEGACLFELKEPEGLLRSMDRIFSEEEMSREMAEKGQAFADKNHRWTNRTDVLLAHIKAAGFLS